VKRELEGVKRDRELARGEMYERYERPVEERERQIAQLDEEIDEARREGR
jgi:hypothetical protein